MSWSWLPATLETGFIDDRLAVVRDGPVNFYVIRGKSCLVCIDSGWRKRAAERAFLKLRLATKDVRVAFLTHLHWDHCLGCRAFAGAKLYAGSDSGVPLVTKLLGGFPKWSKVRGGQTLDVDGIRVEVMDAPGHVRGAVVYIVDAMYLFTGDAFSLEDGELKATKSLFADGAPATSASLERFSKVKGLKLVCTAHHGVTDDPKWAGTN